MSEQKRNCADHRCQWRWWFFAVVLIGLMAMGQYQSTQAACPGCCKVYYR